jgi:peroxiredoxin
VHGGLEKMRTKPKIGEKARSFKLPDQNDKEFDISKTKGKRILLSFHPRAWTSVCAEQMKSLEKNQDAFTSMNTIAVGLSVDTVPSKKAWADNLGIRNTRLLSDFWPHGKIAKLYGIFRDEDGISERVNIIIDENQKIAFFKKYPLGQLPDIQEVLNKLKEMPVPAKAKQRK